MMRFVEGGSDFAKRARVGWACEVAFRPPKNHR